MKSIEQIVRFTIAVYDDYLNRGFTPDIARGKAVQEVIECAQRLVLVGASDEKLAEF